MKVEIKKLDKLKRKIRVEVEGEEFLKEKDKVYRLSSKNLKVPGFRPGTAPLEVLEKYHSAFLKEEFLKKSLPNFYQKALEEHKILPASLPRIYDIEVASDSLVFFADFEVKPEIDIKESVYKNIKIKDKKVEVKEIEIEKVLTNLKENIKKVINKDLDDEGLAHWTSYSGISGLREAIRIQLLVEKLGERRQRIDNQIRTHLINAVKVDLPKSEIDRHHKMLVDREIYNLRLKGVSQEDIDKYKVDLEDKLRSLAEDEVKLFYILEAIAQKENIKKDNNLGEVVLGFILSQATYE